MKITCISDTHGEHRQVKLPAGDLLFHAGDITEYGTEEEIRNFLQWFEKQDYAHKIFIAGNHDFALEEKKFKLPHNVHYLCNHLIQVSKYHIFGFPHISGGMKMAFHLDREALEKLVRKIPHKVDIIVCHEVPKLLIKSIELFPNLKYIISGHIHEAYGHYDCRGVKIVNAALANSPSILLGEEIKIVNKPLDFMINDKLEV